MAIDPATRRAINEAAVQRYFSAWDPCWRWVLILGLRDMRANASRLGGLAAAEAGNESWAEDNYVYGNLALGVTAVAVNEAVQHCEDLFALLSFVRDPTDFARRMGSYKAGKVVGLAKELKQDSDAAIAARFCIPPAETIHAGLSEAPDPDGANETAMEGVKRLGELVRQVINFYETYEFFHRQYKHGLKLMFRPFSDTLPAETIADRKDDVCAPLFAMSNEALSNFTSRPAAQQVIMINDPGPEARPHLVELIKKRNLLRVQMAGPAVDLDDVVDHSWMVSRLLRMVAANRQVLGALDEDGCQSFQLPGEGKREVVSISVKPQDPVGLDHL